VSVQACESMDGDKGLLVCSVYLCQAFRHESFGEKKSCFTIWHEDWDCGKRIPIGVSKRLQFRKPTGKPRNTRVATTLEVLLDVAL
jgi:hypothetical protein